MRIRNKTIVIVGMCGLLYFSNTVFASVTQTINYNFKATAESSVAGREDVVHPSDDASQDEVVVTTGGWSIVTYTGGWTPIFGATAFAANGQVASDGGLMLQPFATYALHNAFSNGLPGYPDYNAEFFLTGLYFPTSITNGLPAFDTGVLNSNWSTQVAFNPAAPPPANILLTGLNPSKVYTFKMAGSLESSAAGFLVGTTIFAVGNAYNSVMVNNKGNTSHYATFAGVSPNAQGEVSLWAHAAWNPGGYIGMLGGIQVIESDATDIPDITFGSDEVTVMSPATLASLTAGVTVGGGASIIEYRWRQVKGPLQATIVSPSSTNTDIIGLTALGVYEFELSALADNGIEQRKTVRVVVDSGNWTKRTITNTNPLANDGLDISYLEYLPDDYTATGCENKRYPVIIYLHGFGQNGTDVEMLKGEGLGYLVDQGLTNLQFTGSSGQTEKFIAILPQLSTGGPWDSDDIDAVIEQVLSGSQYRADYNRIYIDGFSYGSLGLWNYLGTPNKADIFAASVNSAYVPTRGPQYCNANGLSIFAMGEADMVNAGYYISSPSAFTGFMENLSLCPMTPPVIGQIMTGRDHVEMYHFYWQTDYTGFEGKNIYNWFLDHERNYASGGAGQSCFEYQPGVDVIISPSVQTVLPGGTATFNVTIINTGNSDLTGLSISSSTTPNCTVTIPYLAQGSSTGYTCNIANVNAGFLNTLVTTGYAYSGGVSYMSNSDTDITSATVNVATFIPALELTQTPPTQTISSGDNATITILITNTGDVDLSGVVITNPTMPSCDTSIGYLSVGASTGYNCIVNSVISTFTTTTYASGYAYSGSTLLMAYPTATNKSSDVVVSPIAPVFNPVIAISMTPNSQSITAGFTASFTVTITNSGDSDLTGVNVYNPTVPGCNTTIGYLPIGGVAGYSCQTSALTTSFVSTIYTSGYVFSGSVDYTGDIANASYNASVTVNPIVVLPPQPIRGGFGGGGMGTSQSSTTVLSNLPQTQTTTTLSTLPDNTSNVSNMPNSSTIDPTVVVAYPEGTLHGAAPLLTTDTIYPLSTNGTADYKLPYASLRQLLSSLVQ